MSNNDKQPNPKSRLLWNWRRQIAGNIYPLLVGLPFFVIGLILLKDQHSFLGLGLVLAMAGLIASIVSLNWLGYFGNTELKQEFEVWYAKDLAGHEGTRFFVGFARPKHSPLLDPHEDIGFFYISEDSVEFIGEKLRLKFLKSEIEKIYFAPNPHSIVGMGRWLCIRKRDKSGDSEMRIEVREKETLLKNKILGAEIKELLGKNNKKSPA